MNTKALLLKELIRVSTNPSIKHKTSWHVKIEVEYDEPNVLKELIMILIDNDIRFKRNFGELIIYFF